MKSHKIGPSKTPLIIKVILGLIICISLLNALTAPFFKAQYITYFLGLSLVGIKNLYLWQLITYPLIQSGFGITIGFIIEILFYSYLVWVIGSSVLERISQIQYLIFCICCTIFSGLVMVGIMTLGYSYLIFAKPIILLFATLIAWMMLNPPNTKIFLFFAIPIKLYWLVLGLIGFNLLTSLSSNQMVNFFGYISVSIFAYLYSVIIWNRHSPFHHFYKMERKLIYTFKPITEKFKRKKHR